MEPSAESHPGAAVFPLIPDELGISPILLAVLHAVVFLEGSAEEVVHEGAAVEALEHLATYLQRLNGSDLQKIREDMACLQAFAQQEKWPKEELDFLQGFLKDYVFGDRTECT